METREFDSTAEAALIRHVCATETAAVRDGSGVLVCGGIGGAREWIAADLASLTGGALVSDLCTVQTGALDLARRSGLGVVLHTALDPGSALAVMRSGGLAANGWLAGESGVGDLIDAAPRFVHVTRDADSGRLILTSGFVPEYTEG